MKTITKKSLVVIAMVSAITFGSGAMGVSAANPNQLLAGDGGGPTPVAAGASNLKTVGRHRARDGSGNDPVVVAGVTNLETVHPVRHGIGFLP
jgi:hypothetical protein